MELPEGVRILEITPRSLTLHLEPVVEREVPVEARFEGEPPAGFARGAVTVMPDRVRVRGPESHINAVERAFTETISLAGRRETLALPQVSVDIPDHKVVPLDAFVSVRVEIAEAAVGATLHERPGARRRRAARSRPPRPPSRARPALGHRSAAPGRPAPRRRRSRKTAR